MILGTINIPYIVGKLFGNYLGSTLIQLFTPTLNVLVISIIFAYIIIYYGKEYNLSIPLIYTFTSGSILTGFLNIVFYTSLFGWLPANYFIATVYLMVLMFIAIGVATYCINLTPVVNTVKGNNQNSKKNFNQFNNNKHRKK